MLEYAVPESRVPSSGVPELCSARNVERSMALTPMAARMLLMLLMLLMLRELGCGRLLP